MKQVGEINIKKWFIEKNQQVARRYDMWIDYTVSENGYVTCVADFLGETEKAVKVRLWTGAVVGSGKGWETWVPKSVIAN